MRVGNGVDVLGGMDVENGVTCKGLGDGVAV